MNRYQIAKIIAGVATSASIIGIVMMETGSESGVLFVAAGVIGALVSYLFGGLGTAIKSAGGIAKWGFIAVPFPLNLATSVMAFVIAIGVFLLVPIIPVSKAARQMG